MTAVKDLSQIFTVLGLEDSRELLRRRYPNTRKIKIKRDGDYYLEDPMGRGWWAVKAERAEFLSWAKRELMKLVRDPLWRPYRDLGRQRLQTLVRAYLGRDDVDVLPLASIRIAGREDPWMTPEERTAFREWLEEKGELVKGKGQRAKGERE